MRGVEKIHKIKSSDSMEDSAWTASQRPSFWLLKVWLSFSLSSWFRFFFSHFLYSSRCFPTHLPNLVAFARVVGTLQCPFSRLYSINASNCKFHASSFLSLRLWFHMNPNASKTVVRSCGIWRMLKRWFITHIPNPPGWLTGTSQWRFNSLKVANSW